MADRAKLEARSRELAETGSDESDEYVAINRALFESDPADKEACNRLGIALYDRGELLEACEIFERGLASGVPNAVAESRLVRARKKLAEQPERTPEEIVSKAFPNDRDECVLFIADSIEAIQRLDSEKIAVIDLGGNRFRVFAGPSTACSAYEGMLDVTIDYRGADELKRSIEDVGGTVLFDSPDAWGKLPYNNQVAVPASRVAELRPQLWAAHEKHLREAVLEARTPHHNKHRQDLLNYLAAEGSRIRE
ncbi:MAG: hypothetical protein U0R24_10050 [Solirubrobacterales bacterium]